MTVTGDEFEIFLLTNSLEVQNLGTEPTFEVVRNGVTFSSCIDVTLTRHMQVRNWSVSQLFNGSDHHTIHFDLDVESSSPKLVHFWKETDWVKFTELLKDGWDLPATMTRKKLDKQLAYVYRRIDSALDKSSPLALVLRLMSGSPTSFVNSRVRSGTFTGFTLGTKLMLPRTTIILSAEVHFLHT